jgi:6-phosphogluconolactonase
MSPDAKYLAVCDLGMDKVLLYPYSPVNGLSTRAAVIGCPPGTGPRHLAFSADGGHVYVLGELSNTVLRYALNAGEAVLAQEISTLPPGHTGGTSAAIHLSPCGGYIASSNRGHDSVALFAVKEDGSLESRGHIPTGKEPRDFNFSPCGGWLLSADQNGDTVSIFKNHNGTYEKTGQVKIPKPVCLVWG